MTGAVIDIVYLILFSGLFITPIYFAKVIKPSLSFGFYFTMATIVGFNFLISNSSYFFINSKSEVSSFIVPQIDTKEFLYFSKVLLYLFYLLKLIFN